MHIDVSSDRQELRIWNGRGWFALLGFPILLLGMIATIIGVPAALIQAGGVNIRNLLLSAVVGVTFSLLGALLTFGRSGVVVTRPNKGLRSWSRFLWFRTEQEYPLNRFNGLTLAKYWNTSTIGPDWYYRITLRPSDSNATPIELGSELNEHYANAALRRLAEFLELPIMAEKTPGLRTEVTGASL